MTNNMKHRKKGLLAAVILAVISVVVLLLAVRFATPISIWATNMMMDTWTEGAFGLGWSDAMVVAYTISFWLTILAVLLLLILVVLIVLLAVYLSRGKDDRKP